MAHIPDEESEGKVSLKAGGATLRRLMPFLRPHFRELSLGGSAMVITVLCMISKPLILRWVIDDGIRTGEESVVAIGTAATVGVFVIGAALGYVQVLILSRMGLRIVTALKEAVFRHVLSLGTKFHDANPVGKLMSRTESDAESVKELFSRNSVEIFRNILMFVGTFGTMLVWNFRVTWVFLVLVPLLAAAAWVFLRVIRRVYRAARRAYAELSGMVTEYVQGVPVVQQFSQKERALRVLDVHNREKYRRDMRGWILDYAFWGGFLYFEVLATASIVWFGAEQILDQRLEPGELIMFILFTGMVFQPIMGLGEQLTQIQRGLAAADRLMGLVDTPADVRDSGASLPRVTVERGVRFDGVSFSYDGETDVLSDVSFDLGRGEKVALVGPSGGGKTTLVSLLLRFMDPGSGRILVDGRDIRDYTVSAWRSRLGLVLQEIYLFPGSVLDNIRVLDETIPEEQVIRAAEAVKADRFIRDLPDGYRTDLAERGTNLSLGERQLLSFARALTFDPEILVLDEATSSVDPETEARIQESLDVLLAGRTALIVAHRLSTVRKVDRILVVSGGRIVEAGDHESLYAADGMYRELYDLQMYGNGNGRRQ